MVRFLNVQKSYDGETLVVKNLNLDVARGEFLTMLGPSGSGKTTSLMMLAGFEPATHGEIFLNGQPINRVPPHQRGIGMVFQNYALFPHMTVAENLAFPLKVRKIGQSEIAERVQKALDMVEMPAFGNRRPAQLSGGQQQRVAVARALVFEPMLVLMDEPLGALDKNLREQMQYEIKHLHDRLGITIVYVTHDQTEALTMSDRIAVINGGRIMQLDTPRRIYERPANRFVAEFIGESTFVPVTVAAGRLMLAGQPLQTAEPLPADGQRLLMLRPERLRLLAHTEDPGPGFNLLAAALTATVYQGDSSLMQVALPDGTRLQVRSASIGAAAPTEPGRALRLALAFQDTVLLPPDGAPA